MRLKRTVRADIKAIRSCMDLRVIDSGILVDCLDDFRRWFCRDGGWQSRARLLVIVHESFDLVDRRSKHCSNTLYIRRIFNMVCE